MFSKHFKVISFSCYLFSIEKAFDTFNKHKLGEKALETLYRPGGPQYTKGEESFYKTLLEILRLGE